MARFATEGQSKYEHTGMHYSDLNKTHIKWNRIVSHDRNMLGGDIVVRETVPADIP